MKLTNKATKYAAAGALVLAGFGGGAVLASTGSAGAATTAVTSAVTGGTSDAGDNGHAGETPLTGDIATKVQAAALAKYAGATIDRLETDSDGVYEAHIVTTDGSELIVQVGKDFTVTGTQTGGGGDHDGDGPDAGTDSSDSAG
jgi:hypothetical protein